MPGRRGAAHLAGITVRYTGSREGREDIGEMSEERDDSVVRANSEKDRGRAGGLALLGPDVGLLVYQGGEGGGRGDGSWPRKVEGGSARGEMGRPISA